MNCVSFIGPRPKIGISACLTGAAVRFNGGTVRADWISDVLSRFVDFVPVCPEVEMGLSVPREPMRLAKNPGTGAIRLVTSKTEVDHTDQGLATASRITARLPADLTAFILMGRSPMCGPERVKVYGDNGIVSDYSQGVFAAKLQKEFPELIICEAGRLHDPEQRERFALRVFVQATAQAIPAELSQMQDFHRRYKFLISSQGAHHLRALGVLLGSCSKENAKQTWEQYRRLLFICFAGLAKRQATADALTHMYGFVKKDLNIAQKFTVRSAIEQYRLGKVSISVPLHILHFVNQSVQSSYIADQAIFAPYPELDFAANL